jgi:hypothetical protein
VQFEAGRGDLLHLLLLLLLLLQSHQTVSGDSVG